MSEQCQLRPHSDTLVRKLVEMNDEEIIKQRLLIDGDGTGEDRRIVVLLKQFLKWASDSLDSNPIMYDRLMAQFAQCKLTALKNVQTLQMIAGERDNYTQLVEHHEESIVLAKAEIESSKKELITAKQIRKNKMEYDLLASLIQDQPDRSETQRHIETIRREIDDLVQKKLKMERKFQKRRNDFTLLMYTIHELEQQLDQDSSSSASSSSSDCDARSEPDLDDNGIMEVSDEDDDLNNSTPTKFDGARGEPKYHSVSTEDSKAMSVEEDTVLELSIDKDEHDVDVAVAN
uniref:THO complex protein 7 n=1 Tax=Drosophila melanogaster TaxID=7227 RepID=THOC7_DROME|nr:thoc7, isoform A [Drosophila melanogaster]Q8IRJ8.2 RecName: Full=THO complex protein 7 [Drosophila melanogaster]AAF47350.2 thoc7, isoform A [Drosophila melanogaster]|eukprot:NP_728489.2 thoc7, isoform A [Drosophila melanogaster]